MKSNLLDCGHAPSEHSPSTTGYGVDANGKKLCYTCCGEQDRESMIKAGETVLYLSEDRTKKFVHFNVTNWPGSLSFNCHHVRCGRHNIAGTRTDVWFTGPDGALWHGVQYGRDSQLCYCKRNKRAWRLAAR